MCRVGEGWASQRVSIAEEHRATAMCERLMSRIAVHPPTTHGKGLQRWPQQSEGPRAALHDGGHGARAEGWSAPSLRSGVPNPDLAGMAISAAELSRWGDQDGHGSARVRRGTRLEPSLWNLPRTQL